jgi:hypothetical protein
MRKIATITAVALALAMLTASMAIAGGKSNQDATPLPITKHFEGFDAPDIPIGESVGTATLTRRDDGLTATAKVEGLKIALARYAEMPALYEAQFAATPEGIALLRGAELPGLYAAQFAATPEGIALLRGAELPGLYAAQFAATPEGIALLRGAELPGLYAAQFAATP